jgi:hypothetical protein
MLFDGHAATLDLADLPVGKLQDPKSYRKPRLVWSLALQ